MRNRHYIVAGLSDADMLWLLSMGKLRKLKAGEALVSAGRAVQDLFFVTHGSLAVMLADGGRVAELGVGDVVGEMSFIEQHPPSASVRAEEASEVLAISRQTIIARFDEEPIFAARFYRALSIFLSARLRETTASARTAEERREADKAAEVAGARMGRLLKLFRS